jgi:HAD superfamily hydrolase (TIGR01509 family)
MRETNTTTQWGEKRAVLLDFNGTMSDTLSHWRRAYRTALASRGVVISARELNRICFHSPNYAEELAQLGVQDVAAMAQEVVTAVREAIPSVKPFPQLVANLHRLKTLGFKIGVVSNSPSERIRPALDRWVGLPQLDVFITGERVPQPKPHPAPILMALEALSVPASSALLVGDQPSDVAAAREAGVMSIGFTHRVHGRIHSSKLTAANPHHVVRSYRELRTLLTAPSKGANHP